MLAELALLEWHIVMFSETRTKDDVRDLDGDHGGHRLYTCLGD